MHDLEIGIVGCGAVADYHLRAWKKIRSARLRSVCDVNEELARATARSWKVPEYYSSLSELLARSSVNVIDICAPPQVHVSLAVEAMKSNCHVLIEKPLTMRAADADEIVKCQADTGVKVGVIHNWLYEPPMLKAGAMFARGDLGELLSVEVSALSTKSDSMLANEHHWSHLFPMGRFSEMLPHPVYILQRFLGHLELAGAWASKLGSYPWVSSDELTAILKSGKKWGRIYASFNAPRDSILITLYGTKAVLRLDIIGATIIKLPPLENERFEKGYDSMYQAAQLVGSTVSNAFRIMTGRWKSGHEKYVELFARSLTENRDVPVNLIEAREAVLVSEEISNKITL